MSRTDQLQAFRPEWERLGAVAARLGFQHGNQMSSTARWLQQDGLVESKFNGMCLSWRLTEAGKRATADASGPYDPPAEIEGPDNGLTEAVAERLWLKRTGGAGCFRDQSWQVKDSWRATARDALAFLFDIGFVGPAGAPDPARFDGLNYGWLYEGHCWEVRDADGGYVALVNETPDLELIMAAPVMRAAIRALLAPLPDNHTLRQNSDIRALEASLPENRAPVLGKAAA